MTTWMMLVVTEAVSIVETVSIAKTVSIISTPHQRGMQFRNRGSMRKE